jgi:hypothetical protein
MLSLHIQTILRYTTRALHARSISYLIIHSLKSAQMSFLTQLDLLRPRLLLDRPRPHVDAHKVVVHLARREERVVAAAPARGRVRGQERGERLVELEERGGADAVAVPGAERAAPAVDALPRVRRRRGEVVRVELHAGFCAYGCVGTRGGVRLVWGTRGRDVRLESNTILSPLLAPSSSTSGSVASFAGDVLRTCSSTLTDSPGKVHFRLKISRTT